MTEVKRTKFNLVNDQQLYLEQLVEKHGLRLKKNCPMSEYVETWKSRTYLVEVNNYSGNVIEYTRVKKETED